MAGTEISASQIEKNSEQNASGNDGHGNRNRIPVRPAIFPPMTATTDNAHSRNGDDQAQNERRDSNDDPRPNREHDLHAHVNGIAALFRLEHRPQAAPAFDCANAFQSHLRDDEILGQHLNHRRGDEESSQQERTPQFR